MFTVTYHIILLCGIISLYLFLPYCCLGTENDLISIHIISDDVMSDHKKLLYIWILHTYTKIRRPAWSYRKDHLSVMSFYLKELENYISVTQLSGT